MVWNPRDRMLRRLGVAAAACEILALFVAALFYGASRMSTGGVTYSLAPLTFLEAMNVGWAVFFLLFLPSCFFYVRRTGDALDGDRTVVIAEARLEGRRAALLRARSRRR